MKKYEIYVHIFPNGKRYYGQSCDSIKRWSNGYGYSRQNIIYSAIKKYGWDNIEHEILFENLTKEEADQIERDLIAKHKTDNNKYGYNVLIGGKTVPKHKRTKAQNLKDSISHMKKVCCYSRDGKLVATYRSILDASKILNVGFKPISACCNGDKKSAYGYVWRFENDNFNKYSTEMEKGGAIKKPVYAYTLDGKLIGSFDGIIVASKELNVNATSISLICKGKIKQAKGFMFEYANEKINEGTEDGQQNQGTGSQN